MKLSRRELIGAGLAGVTAASLTMGHAQRGKAPRKRAKNIIFMVADGMPISTMTMADHLQQLIHGREGYWAWLMKQDGIVNGLQDTRSLNSVVTDSSAASSAWGSGRRIWNGQVNMFPDGTVLTPLSELMSAAGVRVGLVTTTTITHATPAGFAVQCENRGLEPIIAEKYLKSGVSVLMGGGDRFFDAVKRADKRDLYVAFAREGFAIMKERSEMKTAKGDKLLGIFSDSHLPFTVDRDNDRDLQAQVPTLAEMTSKAIDALKGGRNGFLLQVEGGKVDHANHGSDLAGAVYDQIAFEEAVKVAIEFALKDGETLVVITTDHACGGPSLNGDGPSYSDATTGLKMLANMKASYGEINKAVGTQGTPGMLREVVEAKLGVVLTDEEAQMTIDAIGGKFSSGLSRFHRSVPAVMGQVIGHHTRVQWTSGNHTSDHVLVTAFGPGAEQFAGLTPNMRMFDVMLAHKGLRHTNPTMTYEEALRHRSNLKESDGGLQAHLDEEFWL